MEDYMVKCKNLSYQNIFNKLNFTIQKGKIAVLLGLKGSGKTTLLDCIGGNCEDYSGDFYAENCHYLKELPSFCEALTGIEYIEMLMTLSGERNKTEVTTLIERLCLNKELNKHISETCLYTRKVLILISSVCFDHHNTILIDEPFTDFDIETQKIILEIIKHVNAQGKTLIVATNDIDLSYELADEILLLHNGKIKQIENKFSSNKQYEDKVLSLLMN
jgi:ABC-2 type transport system ATP-binding protein